MAQLTLSGTVGGDILAEDVRKFLANNQDENIEVFINSGGGSVFEGLEVYNTLRASGRNVTTVITGLAASIASVIFLAGDERIAMTGTSYMIHKPSSIALGDADNLKKEADVLDSIQENIGDIYKERTNIEDANALMNDETWFKVDEMATNGITNSERQVKMMLGDEEDMSKIDDLKAELEQVNAQKSEAEEAKQVAELQAQIANAKLETAQIKAETEKTVPVAEPEKEDDKTEDTEDGQGEDEGTQEPTPASTPEPVEDPKPQDEVTVQATNRVETAKPTADVPVWMQSDAMTKY